MFNLLYFIFSQNTYEEFRLGEKEIGDRTKWLKEGMDCNLLLWNGKVTISSHNILCLPLSQTFIFRDHYG